MMWKVLGVVLLLVLAVLAGWFFLGEEVIREDARGALPGPAEAVVVPSPEPAPSVQPAIVEPEPEPIAEVAPDPEWVLPVLNQSDGFVRERLTEAGLPAAWLAQEELVRRLSVVVENAARGEYPRRQAALLAYPTPYAVVERDGRLFADPANHARVEPLLDALEVVPPEQLARVLAFLFPLMNQALAELVASGSIESRLGAVLDRILAIPVLVAEIELERPNVFYIYADPGLEALRPFEKLILRTGPANTLRIQAYARQLGAALGVGRAD